MNDNHYYHYWREPPTKPIKTFDSKEARVKKRRTNTLIYIALIVLSLLVVAPLVIVFAGSLRLPGDASSPLDFNTEYSFASFVTAFERMGYPRLLLNSVIMTGVSVVAVVLLSSMAAYPIARIKTRFSKSLYYYFIAGMIIPAQLVIVPIARTFGAIKLSGSMLAPIVMYIVCSLPFSTFLYVGFLKGLPTELEESAYLEGASLWKRYTRIVFPLVSPATLSVVITQGLWIWNDYFFSMIFLSDSSQYSLPIGMLSFMGDRENPSQWNVLFAACVLSAIPLVIVFVLLQKRFIKGITAGAVKN